MRRYEVSTGSGSDRLETLNARNREASHPVATAPGTDLTQVDEDSLL
jgi:hypothetical protein